MSEFLAEIKRIWPHCAGIRNINGWEIALMKSNDELEWLPLCIAPRHVESYVLKADRLGEKADD